MTGDLNKKVAAESIFSGQERHYLKCIVAKIDLECELTIKGMYKIKQEESD